METELKLSFPDRESLYSACDAAWFLQAVEIREEKTEDYENFYLDTKDRALEGTGNSLRIRHVLGSDYIHTVKASRVSLPAGSASDVNTGLTSRCEWNVSTDRPEFDIAYFLKKSKNAQDPYEILASILVPLSGRDLIAICKTEFTRHTITVVFKGSEMEICLDTGKCIALDRSVSICEMEIELISGEITAVSDLGLLIKEHTSCKPLAVSKLARCLSLLKENDNG